MRGKKTDIYTKAKIIEEKINTDAGGADIARSLNIPERTVNNIINTEFAEVCRNSNAVASLIDRNDNLQSMADRRLEELLKNPEEKLRATDLVTIRDSTFKQNEIIKVRDKGGDNTIIIQI